MKIARLYAVPIVGAYYYDDITSLHRKSVPESDRFTAAAVTPGFKVIREPAEGVSLGLELEDGSVHWGDCVSVSYSGKAGRTGLIRHTDLAQVRQQAEMLLMHKELSSFRLLAPTWQNANMHVAAKYGVSQAVLRSIAYLQKLSPAAILCNEWGLPMPKKAIPIQGSSGNDRKTNADKMIVHRLAALPHSQIDDIETQLGGRGEILIEYARWLMGRIQQLGGVDYHPTVHLDVHGSLGKIFNGDPRRIATYLQELRAVVSPFALRMESVFVEESQDEQIKSYGRLREILLKDKSDVGLVVDEWANTKEDILKFARAGVVDMIHIKMPDLGGIEQSLEAVLETKALGVQTLLGGSCIETELSAQMSVHVALAAQPDVFLAKPGMGVNEAIMLAKNEMARALEQLNP